MCRYTSLKTEKDACIYKDCGETARARASVRKWGQNISKSGKTFSIRKQLNVFSVLVSRRSYTEFAVSLFSLYFFLELEDRYVFQMRVVVTRM